MEKNNQHIGLIGWLARIICIAYAAFISIFAMDVFGEGYSLRDTTIALFMHLIPTFLILIVLIFAWRREWIGGIAFAVIAIIYVIEAWGKMDWSGITLISVPLLALSVLFFIAWYQRKHWHA